MFWRWEAVFGLSLWNPILFLIFFSLTLSVIFHVLNMPSRRDCCAIFSWYWNIYYVSPPNDIHLFFRAVDVEKILQCLCLQWRHNIISHKPILSFSLTLPLVSCYWRIRPTIFSYLLCYTQLANCLATAELFSHGICLFVFVIPKAKATSSFVDIQGTLARKLTWVVALTVACLRRLPDLGNWVQVPTKLWANLFRA